MPRIRRTVPFGSSRPVTDGSRRNDRMAAIEVIGRLTCTASSPRPANTSRAGCSGEAVCQRPRVSATPRGDVVRPNTQPARAVPESASQAPPTRPPSRCASTVPAGLTAVANGDLRGHSRPLGDRRRSPGARPSRWSTYLATFVDRRVRGDAHGTTPGGIPWLRSPWTRHRRRRTRPVSGEAAGDPRLLQLGVRRAMRTVVGWRAGRRRATRGLRAGDDDRAASSTAHPTS